MEKYLLPTYSRPSVKFVSGCGVWLTTADGEKYLDMTSGIAVNIFGHCDSELVSVLTHQAKNLWHTSNLYRVENQETLAKYLIENTFADYVFFTNSGTEATDCALKISRKFHFHNNASRPEIISFDSSFHGRSRGAISTSNSSKMIEGFEPLLPACKSMSLQKEKEVFQALSEKTAAVIIEPIQGEGGVNVVDHDFLRKLRKACDDLGILLVFDEVQCGLGRTGKLFAHEWSDVFPDVMTVAKGIGGGMPLGACLVTKEAAAGMGKGSHGSTYGGNPLACAIGSNILRRVTHPDFLPDVRKRATYLCKGLNKLVKSHPSIFEEVRGRGFLIGLKTKISNSKFIDMAFSNNLLLAPASDNIVRILPPLTIDTQEIDIVIEILDKTARG